MHAKNFYSEFLDILKNDFRPTGAYASMSQSGFPFKYSVSQNFYQYICRDGASF
jgi:hypothetical protein